MPVTSFVVPAPAKIALFCPEAILSNSSKQTMPIEASIGFSSAACRSRVRIVDGSCPTYPVSLYVVMSTSAVGSFRILPNRVSTKNVLPEPVGPTHRKLDFRGSSARSMPST